MNDLKYKLKNFFSSLLSLLKTSWPIWIFFIISLIFFYPLLLQNKIPLPVDSLVASHVPWTEISWRQYPAGVPVKNSEITDSISQFYPWRSVVGEAWRAKKVPLWNPYMFSGTPFLATWHSAVLYPLNFLYLFMSDIDAWTGLIYLQIFLSGTSMYLFLNSLNLKKPAGLLGAVAFSFSGYMMSWLEFATGGHAGLWLPVLLLFELKLLHSNKPFYIVPISLIFFFIYTAGDFQVPFYVTLTYILLGLYVKPRKFLLILTGFIAGIFLSATQLLPTIELYLESIRIDDPLIQQISLGLLPWENIVTFLWPDFFGNVVTGNYWGKWDIHEYALFVGSIPIVFVLTSLFGKIHKYEKFFLILLILSLLFLLPTPIANLPYKLNIPGLATSPAARGIFLLDFCLAVIASFGFSKWLKEKNKIPLKITLFILVMSFVVVACLLLSIYYMEKNSQIPLSFVTNLKVSLRNMVPTTLVLFILFGVLYLSRKLTKLVPLVIILLVIAELLHFSWKNTTFAPREFVFPKTEITNFLKDEDEPFRIAGGIPLNLFMMSRLHSVEGYDPLYPKRTNEWISFVNNKNFTGVSSRFAKVHDFSSPLLDYANVKYVIDYKKDIYGGISEKGEYSKGLTPPKYKEVFQEGRIKVFENTTVLPKVWLGTNYKLVSRREDLAQAMLDPKTRDNKLIILEEEPDLEILSNDIKYSIDNFRKGYNRIDFSVEVTNDSLLFLSESYFPGWSAYVDDRKVKVMRTNYIFQSIAVPRGAHNVAFKYEPKSFRIGVLLSLVTLIFLTVYTFKYAKK